MADDGAVIEPLKATLFVERKFQVAQYETQTVGMHFPVELPAKSGDEAADILAVDAAIKDGFFIAKAHIFEQAGKQFEDKDGVLLEVVVKAFPGSTEVAAPKAAPSSRPSAPAAGVPAACPDCGGADLWDNRADIASGAKSPKSPTFKCKNKGCQKAIWAK